MQSSGYPLTWVNGMPRRPFFEKCRELRITTAADHYLQRHILIARTLLALDSFAAKAQLRAGIRTLGDRHRHRAGDGRHGHSGAEHRLGKADGQFDVNIVAVAAEQRVGSHTHLDQRVASRAAAKPGLTFAPEAENLTVVDPGWNRHIEPLLGCQ